MSALGGSLDFPLVLERNTQHPGKGQRHTFSAIVEGSVAWGEHEGADISQFTYLSGLRYSLKPKDNGREFEIYLQGLVGGWHSDSGEESDVPVAAVGAGVYCPLSSDSETWGLSFQVDRYFPQGHLEAYTQISLGLVLRSHKLHKPPAGEPATRK
jgi:hypothetical protein